MLKNKGVATTFISLVSLITLVLMGLLAAVVISTASRSQKDLTSSLITTIREEGSQQEKLLRQGLLKKGESIAALLAQTGASLIIGYDFDTLQQLATSSTRDQDVAATVFYDKNRKPLTKTAQGAPGEGLTLEHEVEFDKELIGYVVIHLDDTAVKKNTAALNSRIDKLVTETNQGLSSASRSMMGRISSMAVIAVAVLCVVIYFCLSLFVVRPVTSIIADLLKGSRQLSTTSEQLLSASHSLAEGSSEQAASIEETSSSLEEMASMTRNSEANANQGNQFMKEVNKIIEQANQSMALQTTSMGEISHASEETSKIIKTIDEIAFQTNLLALNAAVEAARAGEAGAGFAVVADEVRNLAMRAAEAARHTADLIESTISKVKSGAELVSRTNEDFEKVASSAAKVGKLIDEIAAAATEQTQGIGQVNRAIVEIDKVTQNNTASAEETSSASEELTGQVRQMHSIIAELRKLVGGAEEGGTVRGVQPARSLPRGKAPTPARSRGPVKAKALPQPHDNSFQDF